MLLLSHDVNQSDSCERVVLPSKRFHRLRTAAPETLERDPLVLRVLKGGVGGKKTSFWVTLVTLP